jgi:hypothetical protein
MVPQLELPNAGGTVSCGPPPFDPFAVAYSAPAEAILLLVLPASISAVLALSARRSRDVSGGPVPASQGTAAG